MRVANLFRVYIPDRWEDAQTGYIGWDHLSELLMMLHESMQAMQAKKYILDAIFFLSMLAYERDLMQKHERLVYLAEQQNKYLLTKVIK